MARLLIDANLAPALAEDLSRAGHDAVHVRDVGLLSADDQTIVRHALTDDRILVTFDLDFVHLLVTADSKQPSLVLLRLRTARRQVLTERLLTVLQREAEALARGAIVVVDEHSSRVRPLPVGSG